jgi:hypothetical protein
MTQPVFPIYPVPPVPFPEMVIRSRHDLDTRDAANARNYELWQTDGKHGVYNRPDMNAQAPFQDFLPINSRMIERRYHPQPRFAEDGHRGGMNPYFDKYDTAYDSRNMVRELQAVVYEDKGFEYLPQSRAIVTRGVEHRWLDGRAVRDTVDTMESDAWAKKTNRVFCVDQGAEAGGMRAGGGSGSGNAGSEAGMGGSAGLIASVWPEEAMMALRPVRDDIQRSYR